MFDLNICSYYGKSSSSGHHIQASEYDVGDDDHDEMRSDGLDTPPAAVQRLTRCHSKPIDRRRGPIHASETPVQL